MRKSAKDLGPLGKDKYYGYGQIDVIKALQMASQQVQESNQFTFPKWLESSLSRLKKQLGVGS